MLEIIKKYQILICFFVAVIIARFYPQAGFEMSELGFLNIFIIIIFACIGLTFDKSKIGNIFNLKMVGALIWTILASSFLAPLIGYYSMMEMGFGSEAVIGVVLICASTPTLVAGPIMSAQMGGNFEVSTAFSVIVKVVGIFLIPVALGLFLGTIAKIDQGSLILEMVYLMIIPGFLGQGVRIFFKKNVMRVYGVLNWLVILSNFFLAYIAFSCMHDQLVSLTMGRILLLVGPCIVVHLVHIMITARVGKHILKLPKDVNISVVITACQKNMAVPLSIWAMVFVKTYPGVILTVVIYYLVQFFFDSCLMSLVDLKNKKAAQ